MSDDNTLGKGLADLGISTVQFAENLPTLVIRPSRGWVSLRLRELWEYRELLYFLIWRDVKVRYKQTVLPLPERIKRNGNSPKPLLLAAVGDYLPLAVCDRRVKQGFTFPFDRWLRGQLRSRVERALSTSALNDLRLCNTAAVREVWTSYLKGNLHWSRPWALAALSLWLQNRGVSESW